MNSFPAWYQVYVAAAVLPWWLAIRNGKNVMKLIQAACNQSGNPRRNVMGLGYFILILLTGSLTDNNIHIYIVSMTFICASEVVSISSKSKVTLWMFSALPVVTSLSYNYSESTIHQWKILTLFLQVVVSWTLTTDDLFVLSNTLVALVVVFGQEELVNCLSWLPLGFIPFFGSTKLTTRFVQIFMSLGVPYTLITSSGESSNLIVFIVHALIWMVAESYDDLDELAVQTIPTGRSINRESAELNVRNNYFYNMYALLAGSIVHTDKYSKECELPTGLYGTLERLFYCKFKLALPVMCLTIIHVHMIRKNGGQRYYSLLLSFFYFTSIVFFSFLDVYKTCWNEGLVGSPELLVVYRPLSIWFAVLACSWIADLLLCPPIIRRKPTPPEIPS
ncbi:hypothetical protein GE061_011894 [Apolygus lucorum]|uniref:GPI ethanolamine phosphate transferase 1 C-terminal domain-containing protein n=1 Tax=Apolygus lucorum TaxID=248454 RepID=A0A8S9XQP5_APOLU|nr:hypothetical protein GE061_011894 [Apolygus lucorum]